MLGLDSALPVTTGYLLRLRAYAVREELEAWARLARRRPRQHLLARRGVVDSRYGISTRGEGADRGVRGAAVLRGRQI